MPLTGRDGAASVTGASTGPTRANDSATVATRAYGKD